MEREQWASKLGFILAAVGSAVGLGNVWRFSTLAGESGGAAFLIIYVACILLVGLPVLMAEFSVGRRGQSDAIQSYYNIESGSKWSFGGFLGVLSAFLILSFYGVIAGWITYFLYAYLTGTAQGVEAGGYGDFFGGFIGGVAGPLFWQFLFMAIVIGIVYFGIKRGIEVANKLFMPLLAIILIVLAIYSLTLDGAGEAMNFLFAPDWSAFTNADVYTGAIGQAFFTLSLGMGAMITYASYLGKEEKLSSAAGTIVTLDTLFAIIVGVVIFPIVFTFGIDPASGPTLLFISLPEVFNMLGGAGTVVAIFFFFLVAVAALTSAISLLEVNVAYFMRKMNWSRKQATLIAGIVITAVGIPSALSQGGPVTMTFFGNSFLDSIDILTAEYTLLLGGLVTSLFVGWGWKKMDALKESGFGESIFGVLWIWFIRVVAPVAIFVLLAINFYKDFL
ncbi:sodium-dependent transporter [Aquisalibacillus elongatus]|uniref:NSS family neurotransmitter:Na+ symporter n=1 Tax=Aquisalibacillus elongatus TaxID=485577 RepID=A0A3N5AYK5_9BACI|nr:sodium-dependent transporter [Aquisalibacillus elongatus]RPF50336.1 NSS family neurotransmitter:Na+ symporter [Aquisalibacillus elongatus]